MLNISLDILLI